MSMELIIGILFTAAMVSVVLHLARLHRKRSRANNMTNTGSGGDSGGGALPPVSAQRDGNQNGADTSAADAGSGSGDGGGGGGDGGGGGGGD